MYIVKMASTNIVTAFLTKWSHWVTDCIFQLIVATLVLLGYLFLALFIYVVMREIIVPEKVHVRPIHFFFHPACQEWSPQIPCGPTGCNYPFAVIDLDPTREPILASRQPYRVVLELDMPESPTNIEAGVFMVNLTMLSKSRTTILTTIRPCILHYRSSMLQYLDTVVRLVPLVMGYSEQKQMIPVVLHEDYIDNFMEPVVSVKLTLLSCNVHLYSATLKFEAELRGLTYYLYYYPVSMAMVLGFLIFLFMSILTFTIWARWCTRELQQRLRLRGRWPPDQQDQEGQDEQDQEQDGGRPHRESEHVRTQRHQPETLQSTSLLSECREQEGASEDRQGIELRQRTRVVSDGN